MYKQCKVVMLATNEDITEDSIIKFDKYLINGCRISISNNTVTFINPLDNKLINIQGIDRFNQIHLYIISDEEIKEHDWVLIKNNTIFQNLHGQIGSVIGDANYLKNNCKKIIATTDTDLKIKTKYDTHISIKSLSQIPQQFIEQYITEYNKGNIINDVLVEYDVEWINPNSKYDKLKINQDNTINIKTVKDSFSRNEILSFIGKMRVQGIIEFKVDATKFDKWIEQNL